MAARASQTMVEVVTEDQSVARASQTMAEVVHNDAVFQVRASQTVLEVVCSLENFSGYVTVVC
jgi:hypothetical protein